MLLWLHWLRLLSIPMFSGFVGWFTNVIALRMTFFPLRFVGCELWRPEDSPLGLFGWQGIIPTKAAKMAGKSVDMLDKLVDIQEIMFRLDPGRLAGELRPGMEKMLNRIVYEVAAERIPTVWEVLPAVIKDEIMAKFLDESPKLVISLVEEMQVNITEVFDLKAMVVNAMTADRSLLNQIFLDVGAPEFLFIERSGFVFGFLFGILQAIVWHYYPENWILPVAGFICGWLTNYLALKMIFEPVEPIRLCCGMKLHGLFLKRQEEAAAQFAKLNTQQILNSECIWEEILTGTKADNFKFVLGRHCHKFCDDMVGMLKPIIVMYIGSTEFIGFKNSIADKIMEELPMNVHYVHRYTNETMRIEEEIRTKMQGLSSREFEGVLHPVFQEDELKLIFVGAVLGFAVGVLQAYALEPLFDKI